MSRERKTRWNTERRYLIRKFRSLQCHPLSCPNPNSDHIWLCLDWSNPAWCPAMPRRLLIETGPEPLVEKFESCCFDLWIRRRHCWEQFYRKPDVIELDKRENNFQFSYEYSLYFSKWKYTENGSENNNEKLLKKIRNLGFDFFSPLLRRFPVFSFTLIWSTVSCRCWVARMKVNLGEDTEHRTEVRNVLIDYTPR